MLAPMNLYYCVDQVTGAMAGVVKSMDTALKSMNLEKVCANSADFQSYLWLCHSYGFQVSHIMDQFERDFEHLDVQTQTMEDAMSGVTTLTTPEVCVCV